MGWPNCWRSAAWPSARSKGSTGAAHAHGGDRQPGAVEPLVGEFEATMRLAEHLGGRQPAIVEGKDAVLVTPVGHGFVAGANLEARCVAVNQEAGNAFFRAALGLLFTGGDEYDDEVGEVRVGNEVLGAVDDPVAAVAACEALHATQIGTRGGLGHGQGVKPRATGDGQQIAFALLLIASHENTRRPPPEYTERLGRTAEVRAPTG